MAQISLNVNGKVRVVDADLSAPLLYVLRNNLGLHGPRFGCGLGQCGACTVILEGKSVRSCTMPTSAAQNKRITTLEGLGNAAHPHPLQKAFIEEQAAQCGYCINGMIMTAKALLDRTQHPTGGEIRQALAQNLCRCGTHWRIVRAVQSAARGT